jgi:O-methyltransferase domain/Dimerisation domain
MSQPLKQDASAAMLDMITGFWLSQAIFVAAKLGIADLLDDGPKDVSDLAHRTTTNEQALYRVLRALASAGIFAEEAPRRFRLTPLAEYLQSGSAGSLRSYAIMTCEQWVWRSFGALLHCVQTGQSGFEHVFGDRSPFEFYKNNPEAARISIEGLTSRSASENGAVVSAYNFGGGARIIDVGGGEGTLLASILTANPASRGVLFDMPQAAQLARQRLEAAGLESRSEVLGGNFFESVPAGGDLYVMKKIIHDWSDERALAILQNCRAVMPAHGRLLMIELIVPPGNDPSFVKMLDLLMLTHVGGRERTEGEYRSLLQSAGFRLQRVIPTASPVSLMEAVPV